MARDEVTIPLGPLRFDEQEQASPGTLKMLRNLRFAGDAPNHVIVDGAVARASVSKALAGHFHARTRRGKLDTNSLGVNRHVVLCSDRVAAVDEVGQALTLHTFQVDDAERKAQFAQLGNDLFVAVSRGNDPDTVLQVVDDVAIPFHLPPLPRVTVNTPAGSLEAGTYLYRYAWLLTDGSVGPAGSVFMVEIAEGQSLEWVLTSYGVPLESHWPEIISGVAIYVTPRGESFTELINQPFYRVASIATTEVHDEAANTGGKAKFDDPMIETYPVHDDELLTVHRIRAASVMTYSGRLILGDVSYDYALPDAFNQFTNAEGAVGTVNQPPTINGEEYPIFTVGVLGNTEITVEDADGDLIAAVSLETPAGMIAVEWFSWLGGWTQQGVFSPNSASRWKVVLEWTPGQAQRGVHELKVEATDKRGAHAEKVFYPHVQ